MLLDTNIVIYSCRADGGWLARWTAHAEAAIASVTRVEALGFLGITPAEESAIRGYLGRCPAYPMDEEVIERAIHLRQQKRLKLGDAIIAATALEFGLPLVTRNDVDFRDIGGLEIINPFARPTSGL
ncbi:MAG: type II toxin-antitoxin system VapC family toxin [Terrimicrobiaceae bacterium]